MKLLVIGHLSIDVFHAIDGTEHVVYGGLFRSIAMLSATCAKGDRIVPVCGIGNQEHPGIVALLGTLPGVDTAGLYPQAVPLHRVHYYPHGDKEFAECTKQLAPPIPFPRIKPFLGADGILINMVSGVDIALETLDEIRMAVRGRDVPILLDFHSLTTVVNDRFERVRRPLETWRRWAFMVDIVQFNEEEIGGLTYEGDPEQQTVGHLFTLGVHNVVVTRGAGGATVYGTEHKKVNRTDIPGDAAGASAPSVGRGDLFGAAFIADYLQHHDPVAAGRLAHRLAAAPDPSWTMSLESSPSGGTAAV